MFDDRRGAAMSEFAALLAGATAVPTVDHDRLDRLRLVDAAWLVADVPRRVVRTRRRPTWIDRQRAIKRRAVKRRAIKR
jgi:hypothetical protein